MMVPQQHVSVEFTRSMLRMGSSHILKIISDTFIQILHPLKTK